MFFLGYISLPIQATPNINAMFEIFEPTIAPIARFSVSFDTDWMPTNISGKDVPKATTVRPIINSLVPSFFAKSSVASSNLSAPPINRINDITIRGI